MEVLIDVCIHVWMNAWMYAWMCMCVCVCICVCNYVYIYVSMCYEWTYGCMCRCLYVTTILVIIFWNFTMFQYRSKSPQVKRNLLSSITNLVYKLPHELLNELRLGILAKTRKKTLKKHAKQISNFSFQVQFYWISLLLLDFVQSCSRYFFQDCR